MRGSIWLVLILAVLVITIFLQRRRSRLAIEPFLAVPPTTSTTDTPRAATRLLAALDAHPAGVPDPVAPHDLTLRVLFVLDPTTLLVPFAEPGAAIRRASQVARGTLVVTNRELRFEGAQGMDVAWPVDDIRELAAVPEGILIRADGVADLRGVGGDPGWAPLLPLLVEWASAMHGDDTLASIRARVAQLAGG